MSEEERTSFLADNDVEAFSPAKRSVSRRRFGWSRFVRSRVLRPRLFRRRVRHPIFTVLKYTLVAIFALLIGTPVFAPSYTCPPPHYDALAARCRGSPTRTGCANPSNEKVFIAVSLYDKGGHLADGAWGQALLQLIHLIGEANVFVSIYENDSGPEGARALDNLEQKLKCKHNVVNDEHVPLSEFPTIRMPDGVDRTKRLAYLSEMRNRALRPLDKFDEELGIVKYDKILFLNDVAFRPVDAAQLLFSTNVGQDGKTRYLSACGMDFWHPFTFYDLYAQRDAEGFSGGLPIFPFFSTEGQSISRAAVLAQEDAVPVSSCWGGIVAMQAKYVQNLEKTLPDPSFRDIGSHTIDPAAPTDVTSPVRFRYEPEVFFDACECCLFLADVAQVARKEGETELGTYVNPYVRVAYHESVLTWIYWVQHWERLLPIPQWLISRVAGLPTHNPHRTVKEGASFKEEVWTYDNNDSKGRWELIERRARNGLFCGVREMQLIQQDERSNDKNWENTMIPQGQSLYYPT